MGDLIFNLHCASTKDSFCFILFLILNLNQLSVPVLSKPSRMIFPDEVEWDLRPPSCANGSLYCLRSDSYPYSKIERALKLRNISPVDFESDEPSDTGGMAFRDWEPAERPMCSARSTTIYPQVGWTTNKRWKTIINQQGYIQGVVVEICNSEGQPCEVECELKTSTTRCIQKYMKRRLHSLTQNGQVIKETFLMPSSCLCTYKKAKSLIKQISNCNKLNPWRSDANGISFNPK